MIGDFHIHTKYSYDSWMEPKTIVAYAKKKGLNVIALTDHGTIKGALYAKKVEKKYNVQIVVGAEIATDIGDIIGLNLSKEITCRSWREIIDEIHSQNGIVVLPHPYRGHKGNINEIAKEVDMIEIWNGRSTMEENKQAMNIASLLRKNITVGSDAHLYSEIGNAKIKVNSKLDGQEIIYTNFSSSWERTCSQLLGNLRKKDQLWAYIRKGEIMSLFIRGMRIILKN
jgi:predicted metal-dependent phosphoesterase TrpH